LPELAALSVKLDAAITCAVTGLRGAGYSWGEWSGKTLADHAGERAAFFRQLLERTGVRPGYAVDDGPFEWEPTRAGDPVVPTLPALLLQAISQRQ